MEREELRIEISADAKQAIREIAGATGAFTTLANTGKTSVHVLNEALAELRKERNNTFDATKIAQFNKAIRELEFQAKALKDIGIRSDIGENARRARVALYGLNQVVRDLPFGFIAISNNIPVLLDQFQSLVREEGSVRKAFAAMLGGMVGGAGISLAISALISLITTLSVRFGGLGNAINAVSGNIDAAAVNLQNFNKAFSEGDATAKSQFVKIKQLNDILKDATAGSQAHAAASKEINEELERMVPSYTNATTAVKALSDAELDYVEKVLNAQVIMAAMSETIKDAQKKFNDAKLAGEDFGDTIFGAIKKIGTAGGPLGIINPTLWMGESFGDASKRQAIQRINSFENVVLQAVEDSNNKLKELMASGVAAEDIFGIKRLKTKVDELKKVYDEVLKAEIDFLKARIDGASKYGTERMQLERELARDQKLLADNEATRTIQSQQALHIQLLANQKEYQNKLAKIAKELPIAELSDTSSSVLIRGLNRVNEKVKAAQEKFDWGDFGMDPEKMNKIPISTKWIDELQTKFANMAVANAMAFEAMTKSINEQISLISSTFDDLTSGVLEDFVTKGSEGFETLIQNVGRLVIKLTEAAIKAFIIQKAMAALSAAGGGGGLFAKVAGFLAGGAKSKVAMPGISPGALITTPSISTRIAGNDILVILNRSLRTEGRIG